MVFKAQCVIAQKKVLDTTICRIRKISQNCFSMHLDLVESSINLPCLFHFALFELTIVILFQKYEMKKEIEMSSKVKKFCFLRRSVNQMQIK